MQGNDELACRPGRIRVMLANDQPVMAQGMRHALAGMADVEVVGGVASPDALHAALASTPCDVLVVDLEMPVGLALDGLTMLHAVSVAHPRVRVVVVLGGDSAMLVSQLLAMGVIGVLSKRDGPATVAHAVRQAYHSRLYLGEQVGASQVSPTADSAQLNVLTWREIEVLRLHARGVPLTEIASRSGRSIQTVSAQKIKAMRKLGLANDTALYRFTQEVGLQEWADSRIHAPSERRSNVST